jgi:tRNA(Leu) C34 or U34 (ribose-2'-O)-methylase TrmL
MTKLTKPDCDFGKDYFAIGIYNPKNSTNLGVLIRTAKQMGAAYVFTIGARYKTNQTSVNNLDKKIPIFYFETYKDFKNSISNQMEIIGIELTDSSKELSKFKHPKHCIYLLGSEDNGINDKEVLSQLDDLVVIEGNNSMNLAVCGSIVLYDRYIKMTHNKK